MTSEMSDKQSRIKDFEKSLSQLEELVEGLEKGDVPLDEALKQFEHGIQLARNCQSALKDAELKIQQLIESKAGDELQDVSEQG